jgi:transposase
MTATSAKALLAGVRPRDEVTRVRKQLALDQLTDLVRIDARLKDINRQLRDTVKATRSGLTDLYGVGPVITATVLARSQRHRPVHQPASLRQLQRQRTHRARQRR